MSTESITEGGQDRAPLHKGGRQIRYLAQSVLLEERGMSRLAAASGVIVATLITVFVVWASYMPIKEVAVTFGSVVPASSVQPVQHLEGGIVAEVLVEDREMVQAGQPLVRLDPVQATAELDQLKAREMALRLKAERLRAFAEEREPDLSGAGGDYRELVADQTAILHADRARWQSQRDVLSGELAQKAAEITAVRRQQDATNEQIRLLLEEVEMRRTLFENGHGSKVAYFAVQRELASVQGELSRLQGQQTTAEEALGELRQRVADLDNNQRQNALGELGTVTAELAQVQEARQRAEDRTRRLSVSSPTTGFVQNLRVRAPGTVVAAGGLLMEVVPVGDELLVETKISTRDVGHLHVGQPVVIKVMAYDFVRYGTVPGTLRSISATTYIDEQNGQPYYKGVVALTRTSVALDGQANPLLPGMTVQADVVTGEKTLLQYLLKPIDVSLRQAFRER